MSTKEYLLQVYKIDKAINCKLNQVMRLREMAFKTTSVLTPDKVHSCEPDSKMADVVNRFVDLENEINSDVDRLLMIQRRVYRIFQNVKDNDLRLLLELRYLEFKKWEEIADVMNFDYRWTLKLHNKALCEVEEVIKRSH